MSDDAKIRRSKTKSSIRYDFGEVDPATHKSMQGNKRVNTKPEVLMRHELRAAGYPGYRLDWKKAPGHPDVAYPGRKIAIFVNGCFWHHHENCRYATTPSKNVDYWQKKFATNRERDERTRKELEDMEWTVLVIWECELKKGKLPNTIGYVVTQIENVDVRNGRREFFKNLEMGAPARFVAHRSWGFSK